MWKRDNLRKNLLRVKQIADQNLGRSEKSEVLSEDLQSVEKRVETVKQVCQLTTKKLTSTMQSNDRDRKQKKVAENSLASCLQESALALGSDTIMGNLFLLCSECEGVHAKEQVAYDTEIENNVIAPLTAILDEEIPRIKDFKKNLSRLTLDMDSAKNRWTTALKQAHVHGTSMAQAASKADAIKKEYEEASTKVDAGKDTLAVELFNFVAREANHSQCLVSYLEAKAQYYKNSLDAIEQVLPKMHALIKSNPNKPVYGVPLQEHLSVTEREIALPIEACVCTLLEMGVEEEGLFRIGGMASHVKKLTSSFDAGIVDMEEFQHDIHAVAGSLKQYLRELPEPLLTFDLYSDFVAAASLHGNKRLTELWKVLYQLPKANSDNLRYLIKFMAKVSEKSALNKMTPSNIAIVLGPNLLWQHDSAPNMSSRGYDIIVAELLVTHHEYFFPGEIEFYKTRRESMSSSPKDLKNRTNQLSTVRRSDSGSDSDSKGRRPSLESAHKRGDVAKDRKATSQELDRQRSGSGSGPQFKIHRSASESDVKVKRSISTTSTSTAENLAEITEESTGDKTDGIVPVPRARPRAKHTKSNSFGNELTESVIRIDLKSDGRPRDSPPLPPSKEFHSDVYSTAFALQSLGNEAVPEYMTKVRAMWDDKHHQNVGTENQADEAENKSDQQNVFYDENPSDQQNQFDMKNQPEQQQQVVYMPYQLEQENHTVYTQNQYDQQNQFYTQDQPDPQNQFDEQNQFYQPNQFYTQHQSDQPQQFYTQNHPDQQNQSYAPNYSASQSQSEPHSQIYMVEYISDESLNTYSDQNKPQSTDQNQNNNAYNPKNTEPYNPQNTDPYNAQTIDPYNPQNTDPYSNPADNLQNQFVMLSHQDTQFHYQQNEFDHQQNKSFNQQNQSFNEPHQLFNQPHESFNKPHQSSDPKSSGFEHYVTNGTHVTNATQVTEEIDFNEVGTRTESLTSIETMDTSESTVSSNSTNIDDVPTKIAQSNKISITPSAVTFTNNNNNNAPSDGPMSTFRPSTPPVSNTPVQSNTPLQSNAITKTPPPNTAVSNTPQINTTPPSGPVISVSHSPPTQFQTNSVMSTSLITDGIITSGDSVQYVSPKVVRRQSKKPAPRPPERPHTVFVPEKQPIAQHSGSHTLPRRGDPEPKPRGIPPPRPSQPRAPDKQSSDQTSDVKTGDDLIDGTQTHQRSLSSDSALIMTIPPSVKPGSLMSASAYGDLETDSKTDSGGSADIVGQSEKSPRSSVTHRTTRPTPPPPPPPVNKETEDTTF